MLVLFVPRAVNKWIRTELVTLVDATSSGAKDPASAGPLCSGFNRHSHGPIDRAGQRWSL